MKRWIRKNTTVWGSEVGESVANGLVCTVVAHRNKHITIGPVWEIRIGSTNVFRDDIVTNGSFVRIVHEYGRRSGHILIVTCINNIVTLMPTEVMTMCFHTRDAIVREDASFTFRLPGNRLRNDAMKVALASCEFPMVQWTVEEDWNRLYMNEGIGLTPETQTVEVFRNGASVGSVHLPLRVNPIVGTRRREKGMEVTCKFPHGLRDDVLRGHQVRLLGAPEGDLSLTELHAFGRVSVTDDTTFVVQSTPLTSDVHSLIVSNIQSPGELAAWLHNRLRAGIPDLKFDVTYDALQDRMKVGVTSDTVDGDTVRLGATRLVRLCGISTMPVRLLDFRAIWPSEPTAFWDYVLIPPGFYAPCHRPMCTGQPMRFGAELETALNRLYFPITKQGEPGHQLVFSDPSGRIVTCAIPSGRYTPDRLSCLLTHAMTDAIKSIDPSIEYTVVHEDDHFTFACERRHADKHVSPAPFSILFHHPLCIDASRLGFPSQPLSGSDTYTATHPCRCARGVDGRLCTNVVRVTEVTQQKRFSVHVTTPPPMIAIVKRSAGPQQITIRTYVNRMPFSHGLQTGDLLCVSECGNTVVVGENDGEEVRVEGVRAKLPTSLTCVVADGHAADPTLLTLLVPSLDGIGDVDTAVQLTCFLEPWNMCFDVHSRSIPSHMMGYRPGATQWGVDGSLRNAHGDRIPPFLAPHTHTLDHPDYILMTFSESSGATLEHSYNNENKQVFCKLSLYPLFREERMLPRDTTLLRNQLTTFTLSFWNPDMTTPYKFHGCDFSFSLNFLSAVPDA